MANHYATPQRRKRVIILCTRKDIGILPSDIFPSTITPNPDRQITAYETIFDLENVVCEDSAKYNSSYHSNILDYLKDEISIEEYVKRSIDSRGDLRKDSSDTDDDEMQLSLFETP
jgi:site-specific DNA-cytosine methylase